jgi:hypothetical protein
VLQAEFIDDDDDDDDEKFAYYCCTNCLVVGRFNRFVKCSPPNRFKLFILSQEIWILLDASRLASGRHQSTTNLQTAVSAN